MTDALFDLTPAEAGPRAPGPTEKALTLQLDLGRAAGRIVGEDEPLAASALVLARVLDTADRIGGLKSGYLAAQAQPPFQKACHALRLPVELAASAPAPVGNGQPGGASLSDELKSAFGTAE